MKWADALALASRELRRRPARSLLTVAAVMLAAALLVALLAVVTTARTRVLSQISKGGALAAITVEPAQSDPAQSALDNPTPGAYAPITQKAVSELRGIPQVSAVDAVQAAPVLVLPPTGLPAYPSRVVGADLASLSTLPITLLAGGTPLSGASEVDVSEGYLQHLGVPDSRAASLLGTYVELGSERPMGPLLSGSQVEAFRWVTEEIVGVVDQQVGSGDIVSWPAVADAAWRWQFSGQGDAPYEAVVVVADQLSDVPAVRAEIADVGYTSDAAEGLIVSISRYIHVVEIVLSGIGFVALVIAALGIANALFASVRERRHEIGILKAIGARDKDVLRIFLAEAAAIGLVGGLVGTTAGIGIALVIGGEASSYLSAQGLAGVSLSIPWVLPLAGAAGSAAVALIAGLPAALRAARLPAREAVAR
jgi:ABC-type antimicrobial peptide transport system permease subunit